MKKEGYSKLKFPNYETFAGGKIKEILQSNAPYEPASFQTLNVLDKMLTMKNVSGKVICDRYCLSGIIIGNHYGLPVNWLDDINSFLPKPDLMFILMGDSHKHDGELFDNDPLSEEYRQYLVSKKGNPRVIEIDANCPVYIIVEEMLFWIWRYEP